MLTPGTVSRPGNGNMAFPKKPLLGTATEPKTEGLMGKNKVRRGRFEFKAEILKFFCTHRRDFPGVGWDFVRKRLQSSGE